MRNNFNNNRMKLTLTIFILLLISFLCYIRLMISRNVAVNFDFCNLDLYDRAYYINNALDFVKMTAKSNVPLIKNRGYIWLLLLSHYIGVTPHILSAVFWILAAILGYIIVRKICKSYVIGIGIFSYILFNPIAFSSIGGEYAYNDIYRNLMYVQFTLIYLELLLLLLYEIKVKAHIILILILGILCGIVFSVNYFLSETGKIHVMVLVGLSILFFVYIIYEIIFKRDKFVRFKQLFFVFLPLIVFFIVFIGYKFINYRVYGVFAVNFRTEDEVGKFISNVQDIESDKQDSHYWCTKDQLEKAYKVSDSLKKNKKFYDSLVTCYGGGFVPNIGYAGDFLGWGITVTMKELKLEYNDVNEMFKHINDELNNAFKYGVLTKNKKFKLTETSGRYSDDELEEVKKMTIDLINSIFTFDLLNLAAVPYGRSIDKTKRFVTFFNMNQNIEYSNMKSMILSLAYRYKILNRKIFKISILICAVIMVFNILILFLNKKVFNKSFNFVVNYNIYFILSICFFVFFVLYCFAISCFLLWLDKERGNIAQLYYYYSGVAVAFLSLSFMFIFVSFVCLFRKIISYLKIDQLTAFVIFEFIIGPIIFSPTTLYVHDYFLIKTTNKTDEIDFTNMKIMADDISNIYLNNKQIDKLFKNNVKKENKISNNFKNNNLFDNITILELSNDKYIEKYFVDNYNYKTYFKNNLNLNNIEEVIDKSKDIIILRFDRENIIGEITATEFKENLEKILDKINLSNKKVYILPIGQNINCIRQSIQNDIIDDYYNYVIKKVTYYYKNAEYINFDKVYKKYITYHDINSYVNYDSEVIFIILNQISKTFNSK